LWDAVFVVRMTLQEMAVCRSVELVERLKQIEERSEVTEEASRVGLRLVLQDGKQSGSTELTLPTQVGPVSVRRQLREHVGLYDKLIRDELPDPPVSLTLRKNERFESLKRAAVVNAKK
jgi:hypothetical protein